MTSSIFGHIYHIINYIIGKKIKPVSGQCQREWQCQKLYLQTTPWKAKGTGDWSLKPDRKLDLGASTQASAKTTGILETKLHQNRSFKQKILRSRGPAKNPTGRTINVSFFVLSARGFCWSRVGNKQHSQPRGSQAMCPIHALAWYW